MKVKLKEDPREWRKVTLMTVAGLGVVSALACWRRLFGLETRAWFGVWGVLALLALAAVVRPAWFRGFYRVSMRLGFWSSQWVARVMLTLVFFLVLVPMGLVLRWMGKDPLGLKPAPGATSFWGAAKPPGPLERLF